MAIVRADVRVYLADNGLCYFECTVIYGCIDHYIHRATVGSSVQFMGMPMHHSTNTTTVYRGNRQPGPDSTQIFATRQRRTTKSGHFLSRMY